MCLCLFLPSSFIVRVPCRSSARIFQKACVSQMSLHDSAFLLCLRQFSLVSHLLSLVRLDSKRPVCLRCPYKMSLHDVTYTALPRQRSDL